MTFVFPGNLSHLSLTNTFLFVTENGEDETDDAPPPLPDKIFSSHNDVPLVPPRSSSIALPPKTPRKSKVGFFDKWMHRASISTIPPEIRIHKADSSPELGFPSPK